MTVLNNDIFIPDNFTLEEVKFASIKIKKLLEVRPELKGKTYFLIYHINGVGEIVGYDKKKVNKICKKKKATIIDFFTNALIIESINTN